MKKPATTTVVMSKSTSIVLLNSVFKCKKDGAYYTVEAIADEVVTIRRAPIGATRKVDLSRFLTTVFNWVGFRKAILPQMM